MEALEELADLALALRDCRSLPTHSSSLTIFALSGMTLSHKEQGKDKKYYIWHVEQLGNLIKFYLLFSSLVIDCLKTNSSTVLRVTCIMTQPEVCGLCLFKG